MGTSTINVPFSIAMLVYQRVEFPPCASMIRLWPSPVGVKKHVPNDHLPSSEVILFDPEGENNKHLFRSMTGNSSSRNFNHLPSQTHLPLFRGGNSSSPKNVRLPAVAPGICCWSCAWKVKALAMESKRHQPGSWERVASRRLWENHRENQGDDEKEMGQNSWEFRRKEWEYYTFVS